VVPILFIDGVEREIHSLDEPALDSFGGRLLKALD
jgi:hypothetical protein